MAGTKSPSGKRARPITRAPRTNDARRRDFVGLPLGVRTGLKRFAQNSGIWGKLTRIAESGKSFVAESAAQRPGAGGAPRRRGRCCPARGFVGVAGSRYRAYARKAPAVIGVGSFRRLVVIVDASGGVAARPGSPSGAQKPSFFGIRDSISGNLGIPGFPLTQPSFFGVKGGDLSFANAWDRVNFILELPTDVRELDYRSQFVNWVLFGYGVSQTG